MTPAEHAEFARTSANLASAHASAGRFDEAIKLYDISLYHYKIAVEGGRAENRRCISACLFERGATFEKWGYLERAARDYKDGASEC